MLRRDDVQVRMEIDGKQAISEIGKQELAAYEYRKEIEQIKKDQKKWTDDSKDLEKTGKKIEELTLRMQKMAAAGKENSKAYKRDAELLEKTKREYALAATAAEKLAASKEQLKGLENTLQGVNEVLRQQRKEAGLAGMTIRQLGSHKRDLIKQQQGLTIGTDMWKKLGTEISAVDAVIEKSRKSAVASTGAWHDLAKSIKHVGVAGAAFLGAQGLYQGFRTLVTAASEFEQSISNLSAITGASGDDLQFLSDKARELGATTTLSAQQVADAFTIMASKKPELLDNREALVSTTKAAITLAEAAGIDLPAAADALTNTLNQFGESSDQADKYINVLAAGAKFGAGEIDFLNRSITKFGPAAKAANVSIEESVAMMEVFAEKGLDAEQSGTNFRNILIRMQAGADDTNPAIVGMAAAMENLGKKQLSTTELTKMFGFENVVAAQIMIESSARFQDLTQKVTGTNEALLQAQTRTDNFKEDVKELSRITEEYIIVIGTWITKALRPLVQGLTAAMIALKETPKFIKENKDLFIALGIALVTFNATQIVSTALMLKDIAVKKAQTIWTAAVTTGQHLLNAAMTANPIGLVIKAVGLLVAAFVLLYNRSETVRAGLAGIGEVAITIWEIVKETLGSITGGWKKIFDGDIAGGLKDIGAALLKNNPVTLFAVHGKRMAEAFAKGYKDKLASEKAAIAEVTADAIPGAEGVDPATPPPTPPPGPTPEEIEAAKKRWADLLADWESHQKKMREIEREYALMDLSEEEREIEINRAKYRTMEEDLVRFYENKVITTAEFESQLKALEEKRIIDVAAIRKKYRDQEEAEKARELDGVAKAIDPILESAMGDDELRQTLIDKENAFFDQMLGVANKYGEDTTRIEEARRIKLGQINEKFDEKELKRQQAIADAKIAIATSLSSILGSTIDLVGNKSGQLTAFQKILAVAQIAIDTALALTKIPKLAADSAQGMGPATPIVFAANLAMMSATVLSGIARAKNVLSEANVPEYSSMGTTSDKAPEARRGVAAPRRSYYYGGPTGSGMGFGDQYGEYAGYVHKREYVIPEAVRAVPVVKMQIEPLLESLRMRWMGRGFYTGGPTEGAAAAAAPIMPPSSAETNQLLRLLIQKVDAWPKTVRGQWVYRDWEEMRDEMDGLEKRYKS